MKEDYCEVCGLIKCLQLKEVAKLKIKVFGHLPIKDLVKMWYDLGYNKDSFVCQECIIK
jgi:hypothetical protein